MVTGGKKKGGERGFSLTNRKRRIDTRNWKGGKRRGDH